MNAFILHAMQLKIFYTKDCEPYCSDTASERSSVKVAVCGCMTWKVTASVCSYRLLCACGLATAGA